MNKDREYNPCKYDNKEKQRKISQDFSIIADWMPENHESALTLAIQMGHVTNPKRTILQSTELKKHFNNVIKYCNTVLTAPENSDKRTDQRLRTAIRRVEDFANVLLIADPTNCKKISGTQLEEFVR